MYCAERHDLELDAGLGSADFLMSWNCLSCCPECSFTPMVSEDKERTMMTFPGAERCSYVSLLELW
jgi:hypothetical protein